MSSPLITKAEAAAYLRQSVRNFERHVQPELLLHAADDAEEPGR